MIRRVTTIAAALLVVALVLPFVVVAQDVGDPLATAQAADQQANQAQQDAARRAASLRATAQAGYALATDQAQATATAQALQATVGALQATQQAQAIEWTATARAGEEQDRQDRAARQAASWAMDATATAGAYQAQATTQALQVERARLDRDAARAWQPVRTYAGWLAMIALVLLAVWVGDNLITLWADRRRARALREWQESVIDGDVEPTRRPVALLPPSAGWRPAHLRPKGGRDD